MHHDVDAMIERALHVGRRKGVVNDRENAAGLADVRDQIEVGNLEKRIRGRLHPDHFRIRLLKKYFYFKIFGFKTIKGLGPK